MARRILVPIDGSSKAREGLEYALSTYPDEKITVLHVMTPYETGDPEDQALPQELAEQWHDQARERATDILDEAHALANEYGVEISTALEVGEAWRTIVDYTEENGIDHVIMGSHGRTDDAPLPLGSVAERVMRRSPVLVSIVR